MLTVIGSSPDRAHWAADALASVPGDAIVVAVPGFELGKLRWVVENTTVDRFLFIQDSVIVSQALYGSLSEFQGSVALLSDPVPFGSYLGVYERKILQAVGFPNIRSKRESVDAEIWWTKAYCQLAGNVPVLRSQTCDANATKIVEKHGRQNLVLENELFVKYKGTWRYDQIES